MCVCVQLTLVIIDNDVPPQVSEPPRIIVVVVNDPSFERCPGVSLHAVSRLLLRLNPSAVQTVAIRHCTRLRPVTEREHISETGFFCHYYMLSGRDRGSVLFRQQCSLSLIHI